MMAWETMVPEVEGAPTAESTVQLVSMRLRVWEEG